MNSFKRKKGDKMILINEYLKDGANYQARAVLAHLQGCIGDGIEESWNEDCHDYNYLAKIYISRWENSREQGYVCFLRSKDFQYQINIIWFEHRITDTICAVKWNQKTLNAPNINTAIFDEVYKDKYNISKEVSHGQYEEMGDWIYQELVTFWKVTSKEKEK